MTTTIPSTFDPSDTTPPATLRSITPLAREALRVGVPAADVAHYLLERTPRLPAPADDEALDLALELAAAAVLAREPSRNLEAARLWWRGAL